MDPPIQVHRPTGPPLLLDPDEELELLLPEPLLLELLLVEPLLVEPLLVELPLLELLLPELDVDVPPLVLIVPPEEDPPPLPLLLPPQAVSVITANVDANKTTAPRTTKRSAGKSPIEMHCAVVDIRFSALSVGDFLHERA